jgi:adenosine deaminase
METLPKIELHAHLNGSIRLQTLQDFLALQGQVYEFPPRMTIPEAFRLFGLVHSVITSPERVYRIAQEMLVDFQNENCVYLEMRTTPKALESITEEQYIECITKAISDHSGSMQTRLLLSINRSSSLETALNTIKLARFTPYCVGVELSGNPNIGHFSNLRPAFEEARRCGLKVSIHTAETRSQIDTPDILNFQPDRLGHCNYLSDSEFERILENRIPVELCPSSNMHTMGLESVQDHHFGMFWKRKHPICICTDDTLLLDTTLSKEYELVRNGFGLREEDMREILGYARDCIFDKEVDIEKMLGIRIEDN